MPISLPHKFQVSSHGLLYVAPTGSGKALTLTSKIYTPTGYKLMGEIEVGDQVLTEANTCATVLAVYDQGLTDIYRVTFSDKSHVDCCKEHLWLTQSWLDRNCNSGQKGKRWFIRSTEEMISSLRYGKSKVKNYSIPMIQPVNFTESEKLNINPYLLGVLLGDGYLNKLIISSSDPELLEKCSNLLPQNY